MKYRIALVSVLVFAGPARGDAPVFSYLFPAGARRGTTVPVRVGGLNLHHHCSFEVLGPGVRAERSIAAGKTVWFEGPIIPLPDSQQVEDYPKDFDATVVVDADAALGPRFARVWTAQGATSALAFVVGELPEVVEDEIDGDPVPVSVTLPVTINGRIFPREDVDLWEFTARKGAAVTCAVDAARLGAPLDARIEVRDARGRRIAESDDSIGDDPLLHFNAPEDGTYQVRIHDINVRGGQNYVYRLTVTTGPFVDASYPLGGRRGTSPRFELFGAGLPAGPVLVPLPADGLADHEARITHDGRTSNPFPITLDDLPEVREEEALGKSISLPVIANGRISRPGEVDDWSLPLKKGEPVVCALTARALGSPLDAVLTVRDSSGKELARAEGSAKGPLDPTLRFSAPADGTYLVRVAERFRSRGSARHAYRLKIDRPEPPDFRLVLATDALTLECRGLIAMQVGAVNAVYQLPIPGPIGQAKLKVEAERRSGFAGPVTLTVEGLPAGVTAKNLTIAANQTAAEIVFEADRDAKVQAARLRIKGTGQALVRTAEKPAVRGLPALDSVLLAVALPCPFKVTADSDFRWAARGTVHHRRYKLQRDGFNGPIEVRLADRQARHLQGVAGPTIIIPAGVDSFDYPVQLPPWMETGRTSRSVIMATATVKELDGTEHEVSYTSPKVEEQVIAVVEPGRLNIEAGQTSVAAAPGRTATLPIHLVRGKNLRGPAAIELIAPAHLRGISARPLNVPADQSEAALILDFTALPETINAPVTLRATILDQGDPVIAETKVAIEPLTSPGP